MICCMNEWIVGRLAGLMNGCLISWLSDTWLLFVLLLRLIYIPFLRGVSRWDHVFSLRFLCCGNVRVRSFLTLNVSCGDKEAKPSSGHGCSPVSSKPAWHGRQREHVSVKIRLSVPRYTVDSAHLWITCYRQGDRSYVSPKHLNCNALAAYDISYWRVASMP